jgi:3-phosphoshikimate 1-carboxyvinyltransferase
MAGAIAGLIAAGETIVNDTECIETSFPGFEKNLIS